MLGLELLVHVVSEDDPAVHRTRCLLHGSDRCHGLDSMNLGRLWLGTDDGLRFDVRLRTEMLWHMDKSILTILIMGISESDRAAAIMCQAGHDEVDEQHAKALLDVDGEQHGRFASEPALEAECEGVLEEIHRGPLSCGGGMHLDGVRRGEVELGIHCRLGNGIVPSVGIVRVWIMKLRIRKSELEECVGRSRYLGERKYICGWRQG